MTTRRRNAAAVFVALAVAIAPALTPAALAYDAKVSNPAASARLILLDWDRLDGGIDPFDGSLIPRRAMEHPQEWNDVWWAIGITACGFFGLGAAIGCGAAATGKEVYEAVAADIGVQTR